MFEPKVVVREYEYQWVRTAVDSAELAKLRFIEGWTLKQLMGHFRVGQATIYQELAKTDAVARQVTGTKD